MHRPGAAGLCRWVGFVRRGCSESCRRAGKRPAGILRQVGPCSTLVLMGCGQAALARAEPDPADAPWSSRRSGAPVWSARPTESWWRAPETARYGTHRKQPRTGAPDNPHSRRTRTVTRPAPLPPTATRKSEGNGPRSPGAGRACCGRGSRGESVVRPSAENPHGEKGTFTRSAASPTVAGLAGSRGTPRFGSWVRPARAPNEDETPPQVREQYQRVTPRIRHHVLRRSCADFRPT